MPWIPRGLHDGVVTTRYPRRADGYGEGFHAAVDVEPGAAVDDRAYAAVTACPTDSISIAGSTTGGRLHLDRGRCILCRRCVDICPRAFRFTSDFEVSTQQRNHLIVPDLEEDDATLARTRDELARRVRILRRSLHVRHVDAGSDGADEWEVAALMNPIYDVQRLGIYFTASPRHADLLLVTGVGSLGMIDSLAETFEVMPEPKVVIAAGVDAISGGILRDGYASSAGVTDLVPVDVLVPGNPASPFGLLHGILLAVGLLKESRGHAVRPSTNSKASVEPK
ncbi:MAG: NADH-quinone oxidoreductase subunit B family protein [Acidimicrobiales bacterium]